MAKRNDDKGMPVQIVAVNEDHTFTLNEEALQDILKDVKDLLVVVISIAGAMRQGKSFLLSFFIRYLRAEGAGDWLADENLPLKGFSWKGGCEPDTTGILMWSQPFQVQLPLGRTVAVLLMDTQGAFDNNSTINDCATIFALSTLISSVQIFNIKDLIKENDLQNLQIFTEYGKLAMEDSGQKPFQKVLFLVRDWASEINYVYGSEGGKKYIDKTLEVNTEQHAELSGVRRSIKGCFEEISCFLMPHPGFEVTEDDNFEGRIVDIRKKFVEQLYVLVQELLSPEKLMVKTFVGQQIKAENLLTFFREYMKVFQDGTIPKVQSILKATADASNMTAVTKAKELYQSRMESAFELSRFCIAENALREFHLNSQNAALECFQQVPKLCGQDMTVNWLNTLEMMLEALHIEFVERNKETGVIEEAASKDKFSESLQAYKDLVEEKLMEKIRYSTEDLLNVHQNSKAAAILKLESVICLSVGGPTKIKLTTNLSEDIEKHYLDVQEEIKSGRERRSHSIDGEYEDGLKELKDKDPEQWRVAKYQLSYCHHAKGEKPFTYDPEAWRLVKYDASLSNGAKPFIYKVEVSRSPSLEVFESGVYGAAAAKLLPSRFQLLYGNLGANKSLFGIKDMAQVGKRNWVFRVDQPHSTVGIDHLNGRRPGAGWAEGLGGAVAGEATGAAIGGAINGALFGGVGAIPEAAIGGLYETPSIIARIIVDAIRGKLKGRLQSYKCGMLELKPSFPPHNSECIDQWFKIVLDFIKMVLKNREMFVLTWHDAEDIFIYEPLDYTIEKLDELSYFKARMTRRFLTDACTSPQFSYSEMAFTSPNPNIVDARKLRGCTKKKVLEGNVNVANEYLCMTNDGGSLFWLNPAVTFENVKSVLKKNGSDISD